MPIPTGLPAHFRWLDGERLIRFGEGALADVPSLLRQRGFEPYVLLTTERAVVGASELADGAAEVLYVPGGPVPDASSAVRGRVDRRPLVAVGGGRVIDSAKAIAGADRLRCAAVPTTLSGAELTPFHRMPAGVERFTTVRPALVVAEPDLMASQPYEQLVASAMNAVAHAMESMYVPFANPVSELAALRAVELLGTSLDRGNPDRPALALGALLAGYAVGATGFAIHHAVCQTIVRSTGSPHAETNAVMLPHFARAMESRAPRELAAVSGALGAPDDGGAADRLAELAARSGRTRLAELGVEREQLDAMVTAAIAHPAFGHTPDPPGETELRELLERAL